MPTGPFPNHMATGGDAGNTSGSLGLSSNELAAIRTALSAERTLMSWIRTAMAMLSFGFTIYKFLHGLHEAGTIHLKHPKGPRDIGLFLCGLGTASLAAGLAQYRQVRREVGGGAAPRAVAFYVACVVIVLGLVVLAGIAWRVGPF
jgi:putative membrane protein